LRESLLEFRGGEARALAQVVERRLARARFKERLRHRERLAKAHRGPPLPLPPGVAPIRGGGGELGAQLRDWRKQDLRIGFTNGCFDILHPGHVKVLTAARGACDRLIVGLNSDASVKRLKGEGRPVQDERARAEVLAALEAVDLVVLFEEDTPIRLIAQVEPSVLVKGGDYTRDQVVGHEIVEAGGGEVLLVEVLPGFSTTSLVNRARGGKA